MKTGKNTITDALKGTGAFGSAYQFMLEHDAHAPGSVDRELAGAMVRLAPETVDYLYGSFTPLRVGYAQGSRPELESVLAEYFPANGTDEERLAAIVEFTHGLGDCAEPDLRKMRIGGTEEAVIARGSDWCTDVARVACVLCQVASFPCRMVNLFDLDHAYSGHVIVETYRAGRWGAMDSSTGLVYRTRDGRPASVWDLMNDAALVQWNRVCAPDAFYTTAGQFRAAGIANYFCWERDRYDYTATGLNDYYLSILEMSGRGWPGGLRWLHGEDGPAVRV